MSTRRRNRKEQPADTKMNRTTVEKHSEECSGRIIESQRAGDGPVMSRHRSDDDTEISVKQKKRTVAKAGAKIDVEDINNFMIKNSEILLMRFADFFETALSAVSAAQFQWVKLFRENSVAHMREIPLSHISHDVYLASKDWISQLPIDALSSFVLWSLDRIYEDLQSQQVNSEDSKKVAEDVSSKSLIGIFVALAIVLRGMPYAFVNVLPKLRETSGYQGQDMLAVVAWMIAQVYLEDLDVGLYSWAHNLLPIVNGNSSNPRCIEIVLQIVEVLLSSSFALSFSNSGAIGNGERLIPPSALDILLRVTFPPSSATSKATKRFQAIYFTLKQVALAESEAMEEEVIDILNYAIIAAGETGNPQLSSHATSICKWCLTKNAECYKIWDMVYLDSPEANVAILNHLYYDPMDLEMNSALVDPLREALKNFRQKNKKAIASGDNIELFKEADKYCKSILKTSSPSSSPPSSPCIDACLDGIYYFVLAWAVAVGLIYGYVKSSDLKYLG